MYIRVILNVYSIKPSFTLLFKKMYELAVIGTIVVTTDFSKFSMHNVQDQGLTMLKEFQKLYTERKVNFFLYEKINLIILHKHKYIVFFKVLKVLILNNYIVTRIKPRNIKICPFHYENIGPK